MIKKRKTFGYYHFIVVFLLFIQIVYPIFNSTINAPTSAAVNISGFSAGDGTSNNPYKISSIEDLRILSNHTYSGSTENTYFELTCSLDLSGQGIRMNSFNGNFNGNGNVIFNFQTSISSGNVGFFTTLNNATISNLRFSGGSVFTANGYAGALAGRASNSTITNCHNLSCNVSVGMSSGYYYAGGLIGESDRNNTYTLCSNYAEVSCTSVNAYAAGIAGGMSGYQDEYVKCSNNGNITAGANNYSDSANAAGISTCSGATITNCFNKGTINSNAKTVYTTLRCYIYFYKDNINDTVQGIYRVSLNNQQTYSDATSNPIGFGTKTNCYVKCTINSTGKNTMQLEEFRTYSVPDYVGYQPGYDLRYDTIERGGGYRSNMEYNPFQTYFQTILTNKTAQFNYTTGVLWWKEDHSSNYALLFPTSSGNPTLQFNNYEGNTWFSPATNMYINNALLGTHSGSGCYNLNSEIVGSGTWLDQQVGNFNDANVWARDSNGLINNGDYYFKELYWKNNAVSF